MLYRINKHSLNLPCHNKETEKIVHANQRMGIGVTGYLQATEEQRQWLPDCYEELRAFDKEYSASHGFPVSVKLTTQKPSGTLSLLPGVTPGAHPEKDGDLLEWIHRMGYKGTLAGVRCWYQEEEKK